MNETLKLVLVGQQGAGKTSLLHCHRQIEFHSQNAPTIGVDYQALKNIEIDGQLFDVSIWDTAGQEKFRSITKMSMKNASVAILCFDLSDPNSYQHIQGWIDFIHLNCTDDIGIVIIGTKNDLPSFYSLENLTLFIDSLKIQQFSRIFLTSAKTNNGVSEAFKYAYRIGARIRMKQQQSDKSFILGLSGNEFNKNRSYLETIYETNSITKRCCC